MATTKYTGYTSSNLPATVTTTPVSTPTPSPVVDATKIGTTATTTVPTPPALVVNPNQATQIANYTASSADTATSQEEQKLQAEADAQKARAQSQMTDLAQAQSALGGKAGDLATAYGAKDETGQSVNTLAAQLRQLNAQAQGLQLDTLAKQQAEMNKATGQNITQQAVTRNTADATRENLINMATIGIKSAIAKADYDTAKSYADQIVEAKYSGMEADLASKKTQLEWAMQQDLAPAQKKLADAQARKIEAQNKEIADKKAQEKQVSDLIINASTQGAPQALRDKAMQAKTPMEAANILGEYAGDFHKTTLLKQQIETEKAQRAKIYSSINAEVSTQSQKEADAWVANVASGKAKLSDVPAKLKGLVSIGLASSNITDTATKSKIEASQSVYDIAQELLTAEGKGGAVGFGFKKSVIGSIPFVEGGAIAGTDRATYEAKFKQLKDTLASANLDKLKGAMSDKDIEFLRNIGTALSLDMPETAFDAELKKVQNTMAKVPGIQVQQETKTQTSNKFNQALGIPSTSIQGTNIIKNVDDGGNINFIIP